MDDDARERLVRRTRDAMIEVRNADGTTLEQARAALSVIEPVVREDERDACKLVIDGGHFLHDQAPTRLWANDLLAAIDRDAVRRTTSPQPKEDGA